MEVVRKFVDAKKLMSVISLPETMRNRRLEVIILPAEDQGSIENVDDNVEDIIDSLTGIIPDTGLTLEAARDERLRKYENID